MTLEALANERGVAVASLRKKIQRSKSYLVPEKGASLSPELLDFLTTDGRKRGKSGESPEIKPNAPENEERPPEPPKTPPIAPTHPPKPKPRPRPKPKPEPEPEPTDLQKKLSADWLIVVVMLVILLADGFAFGVIGHHNFGKIPFAGVAFGVIGLATGVGSIATYNRVKDMVLAERWKYVFAVLQFAVFTAAVNEWWTAGEIVMGLMFVTVFAGVQAASRN